MAEVIQAGSFVTASERRAAEELKKLPVSWKVICNKELVAPSGATYEVDFIVVGDHAVFAIDEKSWSGEISGNENKWLLPGGEPRANPLAKIGHVARQLAGVLRKNVPYLHDLGQGVHFVHPAVLLSAPDVQVRVADPRQSRQILRLSDVLEVLPRLDADHQQTTLSAATRNAIEVCLTDLKTRPAIPKVLNKVYTVEEVLPTGRWFRTLRVRHSSGDLRVLKLFEVNPLEQPQETILREYHAVHRAALSGASAGVDLYFFWNEERYLVVPFHIPDGHSLRRPVDQGLLEKPVYALNLMKSAFQSLRLLHDAGVIHRGLTPDAVFVCQKGDVLRVQFGDFQFAHVDQRQTIASELDELEKSDPYLAPECRISFALAEPSVDVYGLALSISAHIAGSDPKAPDVDDGARRWVDSTLRLQLGKWPTPVADDMIGLLQECVSGEPRDRPDIISVQNRIQGLIDRCQRTEATTDEEHPSHFDNGHYRVVRVLGQGATADTYLVEDMEYTGQFVLKRIRNKAAVQRYVTAEFNALKDLHHPNLPRVYEVRRPSDDFHLKLEYIPGVPLYQTLSSFHWNPERLLKLAEALLDALSHLEEHGILHRDISPKNVIVSDQGDGRICLIDFGLARLREGTNQEAFGTPLYRDPDVDKRGWTKSADVYSCAAVLYEAFTGALPGEIHETGMSTKAINAPGDVRLTDTQDDAILAVLRRALRMNGTPIEDASLLLRSLRDAAVGQVGTSLLSSTRPTNEVRIPWVTKIQGLYRNSGAGNTDNRGLDSDFARETYVPTLLDERLLPDILSGNRCLVFLTGNPGDGKTAFLEKVHDALVAAGATEVFKDQYGWKLTFRRSFTAIYDASESRGDLAWDVVLGQALDPYAGDISPATVDTPTVLVAINDGRLHQFVEQNNGRFGWLCSEISSRLFDNERGDPRVALIDLKQRALAALPENDSLFRQVLRRLVHHEAWERCHECTAKRSCPIRFNAAALRDTETALRTERLFLIQHWRRNRRATIRDIRSALAYLITANLSCDDIHAENSQPDRPPDWPLRTYFQLAFNARGESDEMLKELGMLDPAQRAQPRLDRFLHFSRTADRWQNLEQYLREPSTLNADGGSTSPRVLDAGWHIAFKRRLYFEGDDRRLLDDRWHLPPTAALLPYRHLESFENALHSDASASQVLPILLAGVSRAEGLPKSAAAGTMALVVAQSRDEEITVIKKLDEDQFGCRVLRRTQDYVESVPDTLSLFHKSGNPSLEITLDLFEVLCRFADGYMPESQEFEPYLIDIREFKARLLQKGANDLLLLEGRSKLHSVSVRDGVIHLLNGGLS